MRRVSEQRKTWLENYGKVLKAWKPSRCARCRAPGSGWVGHGGNLHAHHPYGRSSEWACCCVLPLCENCHLNDVHGSSKTAREDGWLVRARSKFERDTM
jgi:hypothetical protein